MQLGCILLVVLFLVYSQFRNSVQSGDLKLPDSGFEGNPELHRLGS